MAPTTKDRNEQVVAVGKPLILSPTELRRVREEMGPAADQPNSAAQKLVDLMLQGHFTPPPRVRWRNRSPNSFIAQHGRNFRSAVLTDDEKAIALEHFEKADVWWKPRVQQCYANSQTVVLAGGDDSPIRYVEGYRVHADFDVVYPDICEHGWLELNGKVIDRTGRPHALNADAPPTTIWGTFEGIAYFGVPFSLELVRTYTPNLVGRIAPLIFDWERMWPVLRYGLAKPPRGWRRRPAYSSAGTRPVRGSMNQKDHC